jgi:hypothetical protein
MKQFQSPKSTKKPATNSWLYRRRERLATDNVQFSGKPKNRPTTITFQSKHRSK